MKKKLSPILAALLVVLALLFGVPGGDEAPDRTPADAPLTGSGEVLDDSGGALPDTGEDSPEDPSDDSDTVQDLDCTEEPAIDPYGSYTTKEDVALYIHTYGHLPQNFMTKSEARQLGWEGGGLESYAPGMCIGGDRFGNYEGLLPEAAGRQYYECDIDTLGADSRGAKRIVFSNDGLIYYTDDHYESFELLYGEE